MSRPVMPPIRYSRAEVLLMCKVYRFFRPKTRPTHRTFGLAPSGEGFVWHP